MGMEGNLGIATKPQLSGFLPPPPPPGSRGGGAEGMLLRTPPDRQHLHLRLRGQTASLSR